MRRDPELTIVVPLYNEAPVLPELAKRLRAACDALGEAAVEIVCVDDGSTDATPERLRALHHEDARFKLVRLSRNFGHQMALSAGLEASRGAAVAILDADLQDPPELLPKFVELWRQGHHVVYGVRRRRQENVVKRGAYALFYRLLGRLSAIPIPMDAGDFCLMDRRVVDELIALPERTRFLRGLRSWVGFRQIGVPYERPARGAGRTKYSLGRLFQLGLDGILSFSHLPLRLASLMGVATAALASLALVFYFGWWLTGTPIAGRHPQDVGGFMTLVTVLLFFSGVQLLCLGILGEYVGRIFQEAKRRPGWVVAERLGFDGESEARQGPTSDA